MEMQYHSVVSDVSRAFNEAAQLIWNCALKLVYCLDTSKQDANGSVIDRKSITSTIAAAVRSTDSSGSRKVHINTDIGTMICKLNSTSFHVILAGSGGVSVTLGNNFG